MKVEQNKLLEKKKRNFISEMEIESQEEEIEVKRKKKISKVVVNKEEKNLFKDRIEGLLKQIQFD